MITGSTIHTLSKEEILRQKGGALGVETRFFWVWSDERFMHLRNELIVERGNKLAEDVENDATEHSFF